MKFRSEAKPAGGGKSCAVELNDLDMADIPNWDTLSTAAKWRKMTDRADMLVVEYLARRGDISPEYAAQRIAEIKSGSPADG